jgi:hypothetical protein
MLALVAALAHSLGADWRRSGGDASYEADA